VVDNLVRKVLALDPQLLLASLEPLLTSGNDEAAAEAARALSNLLRGSPALRAAMAGSRPGQVVAQALAALLDHPCWVVAGGAAGALVNLAADEAGAVVLQQVRTCVCVCLVCSGSARLTEQCSRVCISVHIMDCCSCVCISVHIMDCCPLQTAALLVLYVLNCGQPEEFSSLLATLRLPSQAGGCTALAELAERCAAEEQASDGDEEACATARRVGETARRALHNARALAPAGRGPNSGS
jgi:hypothetical protein